MSVSCERKFLSLLMLLTSVIHLMAGNVTLHTRLVVVTPEEYGAIGDGRSDDTQAIQDAVNNNHGKSILFAARTYLVSSSINIPADVQLIGQSTRIVNKNSSIRSIFISEDCDNILIDGFELDFGAKKAKTSNSRMFRDGVITLSGQRGCSNVVIRNCIIHGLNYNQAGIVVKGDHNEISHCEVYSGTGNRRNAGIVCGSYDHGARTSLKNGGCDYATVHDCYVHDISIGSTPDESGYGIYLLACNYSSVFNCRVENCNWVCINSQSEENLPGGNNNIIYNNVTKLDGNQIFPRIDYIGPYNIYLERSANTMILNNVMKCGAVSSQRYIPLQISGGSSNCIVRGNRFESVGKENVFALVGADESTIYESNFCDFAPPTYFFCYDNEVPILKISNCQLEATEQIVNYFRKEITCFEGSLSVNNCSIRAPKFNTSSSKDNMDWVFTECTFSGNQFLFDYNNGKTIIENCEFNNVQKVLELRYGSGVKIIKNCKIENDSKQPKSIVCHVRGGDYEEINVSLNTINIDQGVVLRSESDVHLAKVNCIGNKLFGNIIIGINPILGKVIVERNE